MSSIATHGFCKKCSEVQPILWENFKLVTIDINKKRSFTGMEAVCEVCGFIVAKVGSLSLIENLELVGED